MHALVLAGSRGGIDPVASYAGVSHKALIGIAGQTMLSRVVSALREAGARTVLLGPEVLRSSTAGPAALAVLSALVGRWG